MTSRKGTTILSLVMGCLILAISFLILMQALSPLRKNGELSEEILAENYAIELLESFVSLTPMQLASYLSTNPASSSLAPYSLCAHINLLDRTHSNPMRSIVLNQDSSSDLSHPNPLDGVTADRYANRFYQVFLANRDTLQIDLPQCVNTTKYLLQNGSFPPTGSNDVTLVTVGVSWYSKLTPKSGLQRVVLSAIIPEAIP